MPNENNNKKRKDFVADSALWVNDKEIDKSVFVTQDKYNIWDKIFYTIHSTFFQIRDSF